MSIPQLLRPVPYVPSNPDWPRLTRGQRWRVPVLCTMLLLGFAGNIVLSRLTPSPDDSQVVFVTCWLLTYLPYLVACILILVTRPPGGSRQRAELLLLFVGAFALRVPLLFNAPNLSHDSWRYVWDARVFLHGYSPYVYAPGAPVLAHMRDFIFANSRFRNVPTIYPPAAQYVYILSYLIVPSSLYFLKFVFLVFDMGSCFVLTRLLVRKGLDPARALLYAWCPLPIVEFALEGHVDVITITFSLLAILAAQSATKRGRVLTGFLVGLATLTKFYPILLLVPMVRLREWRRDWLLVLSCLLTIVVGYLPFLIQGHGQIFGFLSIYTNEQGQNAGVIQLLTAQIGELFQLGLASIITLEHFVAFILVCVISLSVFLLRQRNRISLETGALVLFGLVLSVSSHVFPWYVTALLPWVVLLLPARERMLAGPQAIARLLALAGVWLFVCVISGGYIENWPTYYLLIYDPLIAELFIAAVIALYVVSSRFWQKGSTHEQ